MSQPFGYPRVGVGAIVRRDGKVLLGLRRGSHGAGEWSFPGGHVEKWESAEACGAREVLEETGLDIVVAGRVPYFSDDRFPVEDRHYFTLYVVGDAGEGDPAVLEPDKCVRWAWFDWDDLPTPLFGGLQALWDSGWRPFDG